MIPALKLNNLAPPSWSSNASNNSNSSSFLGNAAAANAADGDLYLDTMTPRTLERLEAEKGELTFDKSTDFLAGEYRRFERERQLWEKERLKLESRIDILVRERERSEALKYDLARRIKVLEFALRQERTRYFETKGRNKSNPGMKLSNVLRSRLDSHLLQNDVITVGSPFLKQYLEELGCQEVWSLVAKTHDHDGTSARYFQHQTVNPAVDLMEKEGNVAFSSPEEKEREKRKQVQKRGGLGEENNNSTNNNNANKANTNNRSPIEPEKEKVEENSRGKEKDREREGEGERELEKERERERGRENEFENDNEKGRETEKSKETDKETSRETDNAREREAEPEREKRTEEEEEEEEIFANTIGAHFSRDVCSKEWNELSEFTAHMDSIRCVSFHPTQPIVLTGSEDGSAALSGVLSRSLPSNASTSAANTNVLHTFRSHSGPVYCCLFHPSSPNSSLSFPKCVTAGADCTIKIWSVPEDILNLYPDSERESDPPSQSQQEYDATKPIGIGKKYLERTLTGHSDVVWSLDSHPVTRDLVSSSADATVRIWSCAEDFRQILQIDTNAEPSCAKFLTWDNKKLVVSLIDGTLALYDAASFSSSPSSFSSPSSSSSNSFQEPLWKHSDKKFDRIGCLALHPTLPIVVVGTESGTLKWYDVDAGVLIQTVQGAHKEGVAALAVDPSGTFLASVGHEATLRVWDFATRKIVQEFLSIHNRKYDESATGLAYHPAKSFLATVGVDALVKVFN